jgi:protein translocase SecG subunit
MILAVTTMDVLFWTTMSLFVFVCFIMILLVLIQKGRGGGLASAFGGGGGHTPFGTKTGDVLTWATSIVFGVFVLLAMCLNWLSNARQAKQDADTKNGLQGSALVVPAEAGSRIA